jgi:hypothetical protein
MRVSFVFNSADRGSRIVTEINGMTQGTRGTKRNRIKRPSVGFPDLFSMNQGKEPGKI